MLYSYLTNFLNKPIECIRELLKLYTTLIKANFATIFLRLEKYCCLDCNTDPPPELAYSYIPEKITEYSSPQEFYRCSNTYKNITTIPIFSDSEVIGVICIIDRENIEIPNLAPLNALTEFILSKYKLSEEHIFLANISHEIRTPLNGVIGYNQLLMQTQLTSTQKSYVTSMNSCSIQLMQIINDVLDFSKLTSNKMSTTNECFAILEVVETVKTAMNQRITEKRQNLKFIISEEVPTYVLLDKQKLIQIVINLVSNSSKFSDIGGNIEVTFFSSKKDILSVAVKDNGVGISDKDQEKLFSSFKQVRSATNKTGTGLGLAISQKLAGLLGGDISVKSSIGLGSVFTLQIKFQMCDNTMKKDADILKNKIVLVVDDNADNRLLISELLYEWGMKPIICASALEALRMVLGNRYDFSLGLIDICMPITNGSELAKQIKEEKPLFPLIALSSIDSFVNTVEFEQKLDKPINKIQLFNAIYKILKKKKTPSSYIGVGNEEKIDNFYNTSNLKILIAEDIIYNRQMIRSMLENLKYRNIDEAANGKETLEAIEKKRCSGDNYDVLLLDLRMPVMSGLEVINIMLRKKYSLPKIAVITASVLDEDKEKCRKLGVKYFITKPIEMQKLKEILIHISET